MERFKPRTGDAVWVEGCDPAWYKREERGKFMNAEVINTDRDGAFVRHFDFSRHGVQYYDNELFERKHYDPGEEQGFWIIVY